MTECMRRIQTECYKIGIPLRTRHREVAPNQYEFAPTYGPVSVQIDQNLMVMQIVEETAKKYGLVALFQEKPFQGVNGSGKHNNWSLRTNGGVNLFNPQAVAKAGMSADVFPVVMAAVLEAVSKHSDLIRMSIACPGNDFRLGACEAPPAIITAYLGESLTSFLSKYSTLSGAAGTSTYQAKSRVLSVVEGCPPITVSGLLLHTFYHFIFAFALRFHWRIVIERLLLLSAVIVSRCVQWVHHRYV